MMKLIYFRSWFRGRGQFRWKLVSPNGKKLANPGESFKNKQDMIDNWSLVRNGNYEIEDRT